MRFPLHHITCFFSGQIFLHPTKHFPSISVVESFWWQLQWRLSKKARPFCIKVFFYFLLKRSNFLGSIADKMSSREFRWQRGEVDQRFWPNCCHRIRLPFTTTNHSQVSIELDWFETFSFVITKARFKLGRIRSNSFEICSILRIWSDLTLKVEFDWVRPQIR